MQIPVELEIQVLYIDLYIYIVSNSYISAKYPESFLARSGNT